MRRRGRRGPGLLGTAVVVGGAAHMGAKSAERSQAAAQQEAAQNAQIPDLQAQQAAAAQPPAAVAAPAAPEATDEAAEIKKYADLKEQGLITEEEFAAPCKRSGACWRDREHARHGGGPARPIAHPCPR